MRNIGNFSSWINPMWVDHILKNDGQARPRDWPPSSAAESAEYLRYQEAGYNLDAVNWWVYEQQDLKVEICPPWVTGKVHWWFTKLNPGQYMPIHADPHVYDAPCNRYWMPLQDYESGHVFIYKDSMINNYKKGDVFQFDKSNELHGAANIGHTIRIMLLITEYI
jgi:hypothetical protein